jgi:purine-binding chemotaxis protein CheW
MDGRTGEPSRLLVFTVGDVAFALPIPAVRRILPMPWLLRPPLAPPVLAGVFDHQGATVAVLRPEVLLGLAPLDFALYQPIVLLDADGGRVGLRVGYADAVVDADALTSIPLDPTMPFNGCAVAVLRGADGRTVHRLAPDRLLTRAQAVRLRSLRHLAAQRASGWREAAP